MVHGPGRGMVGTRWERRSRSGSLAQPDWFQLLSGPMRVRVLGPVELDGDGTSQRPKERAVITMLALNAGDRVPVEHLIDSLWGEEPPRTATHTLQGYVSRLRGRLGPDAITGHDGGYRLDIAAEDIDRVCFESMVEAGRAALENHRADRALARLVAALALWRGDPSAKFASGSPAAADVARLVEYHRGAEEIWARASLASGRAEGNLPELERMVRAEPLRELRWELLMVALYRAGRQGEALRAFGRAREELVGQLGIEPGERLRSLEQEILLDSTALADRFPVAGAAQVEVDVPLPQFLVPAGPYSFVGREAEHQVLSRAWKDADADRRVVLLTGEPGIGKTRLVAEVASEIRAAGGIVLGGRCDEGVGVAYQPFAESLRWFAAQLGPVDPTVYGESGGELTRLVPRMSELAPGLPAALVADEHTEQYALFDAVASWLATIGADDPVLLVLEDLQWGTLPTLQLLRHLVHTSQPLRLLIVGTVRDTERGWSAAANLLITDLSREQTVAELPLTGLDEDGVCTLVEAAGQCLDKGGVEFAAMLHGRTQGNPLFVGELLRHLVDRGVISDEADRQIGDLALDDLEIPAGVRDVVRSRVDRLSGGTRSTLDLASVAGPEFEVAVLEAALGGDRTGPGPPDVVDALDEASAAGLLVERSDPVPAYRFAHELVRAVLLSDQSAARRVRSHGWLAAAIEQLHAATIDDHLAAVAHHTAEASVGGDTSTAVGYATRAGRQALQGFAFDDAATWHGRALELFEQGEDRAEATRCDLMIELGDTQRQAGDPEHRGTLLDAAALAESLGDADRLSRAAFANFRGLATHIGRIDEDKVRVLESALVAVGTEDSRRRSRLLAILSEELSVAGGDRVRRLASEAAAVARRIGDRECLIEALGAWWMAYPGPEEHLLRAQAAAEMLTLADAVEHPRLRFAAAGRQTQVAAEAGDLDRMERALERAEHIAEESHGIDRRAHAGMSRVTLALLRGDLPEAARRGSEADGFAALGGGDLTFMRGAQNTLVQAENDEFATLAVLLDEVLAVAPEFRFLQCSLAWARAELGERDRANVALESSVSYVEDSADPPSIGLGGGAAKTALAVALLDDVAGAETLYPMMTPWSGYVIGLPNLAYDGVASRFLGALATVLGRFEEADEHFAAAETQCRSMGARLFLAHNDIDQARMLLRRNRAADREKARGLIDRALEGANTHGYRAVRRHAIHLSTQLDQG
jgi:DNA-binding SARP family transcriptional activator